jgi:3'(2'), 5'-bisphosphate nucleotidase
VDGKSSGNANTDALTLADLSVQELLVAALRDADPILRTCRIEGEETTGDMALFSKDSPLAIAIDPIDGTKQYRDKTGNGYSIIVHLHDESTPHYSLVFAPEMGPTGTWVEVTPERIVCGPDDVSKTAREVLDQMPNLIAQRSLQGRTSDEMQGSIYPLMATGEYAGSLIHSPNIYDFPVSMHIARVRGGDAVWVHNRQPVHYRELWMDTRAGMLRYPGIVACSEDAAVMNELCQLSHAWSPVRYED